MTTSINIHEVVRLEIGTQSRTKNPRTKTYFYSQDIVIIDKDGNKTRLTLFGEDSIINKIEQ